MLTANPVSFKFDEEQPLVQMINRRACMASLTAGMGLVGARDGCADTTPTTNSVGNELKITDLRITPVALPDPPLLSAGGCHGPYFLRNIIEIETDAGITGIGETRGGEEITTSLEKTRPRIKGQSVFAYRQFVDELEIPNSSVYSGIELACLDAVGQATGRRVCELLGGPVRDKVEFASYLFFRYPADHPVARNDPRLVDNRRPGSIAFDAWGDIRTPEAIADVAWKFHQKWGFRVHKLKAGVFNPDMELETLRAISQRFAGEHKVRIDPNSVWTVDTALRIGQKLRDLPLEYYEDPVAGQEAMAEVRRKTSLPLSTNSVVTRFHHIPDAVRNEPIDVVLGDHHGWGGITAFQALGTMTTALNWGLSQHSNSHAGVTMAAMIHVGAVTPQLTIASDTHYIWLVDDADIIAGPKLPILDGHMSVPVGPGLGVTLDQDKVARAHETYNKCGMRRRDDEFTMRRFQPGWERTLF